MIKFFNLAALPNLPFFRCALVSSIGWHKISIKGSLHLSKYESLSDPPIVGPLMTPTNTNVITNKTNPTRRQNVFRGHHALE